ncbi:hypothetical protein [Nonomuraea sp. B19D2]|uniref:hypothetical protein n=1 Tax=Nonomuraea sp. B19D2 TaxID=3159561 RepID=UPI0032DAF2D5
MTKVGILLGAAVLLLAGCKSTPRELIAEDNAKEAAVLTAARDAAKKLDGIDKIPTFADVQAVVGSDFQVSGGDYRSYDSERTVYLFEISNTDGSNSACLNVDATFKNFEYTITTSADPGVC